MQIQNPVFFTEDIVSPVKDDQTQAAIPDEHADHYLNELDRANKNIDRLYHFIEMTEALTYDQATAKRIRSFLIEENIWTSTQQN